MCPKAVEIAIMFSCLNEKKEKSQKCICAGAPRAQKTSGCTGKKVPKIDPNITKFAFYCIFTLQFSKTSGCTCTHGCGAPTPGPGLPS